MKTSYTSYCKSTEKETHDEIPYYKERTNQASLCLQHRYLYIQCKYSPLINILLVCAGEWIVMTPIRAVKVPSQHLSSRRLGGKQNVYWWYLHLANLNVYLTNICFTNLYLTNLRRVQNAFYLEPNNLDIRLVLKHTNISILSLKSMKSVNEQVRQ